MLTDNERADRLPVRVRQGPRVPPLLIAVVMVPLLFVLVRSAVDPSRSLSLEQLWTISLLVVAVMGIPAALLIALSWATIEVRDAGLFVRGRLAVPADELGKIELLGGADASWFHITARREGLRVPARQNFYGGGFGWGQGVAVEHLTPDGRSTYWLLPGRRAGELAAALQAVRDSETLRRSDEQWSVRFSRPNWPRP